MCNIKSVKYFFFTPTHILKTYTHSRIITHKYYNCHNILIYICNNLYKKYKVRILKNSSEYYKNQWISNLNIIFLNITTQFEILPGIYYSFFFFKLLEVIQFPILTGTRTVQELRGSLMVITTHETR